MIEERDLIVTMRDGTRLAVDVYRPDEPGKYPVLYACALHNKDIQGPDIADILPPQPAHAPLWFGPIEAGDTRRFIANGYVHVIAQPRGSAKSEGHYGHEDTDHYDMIEWITQQPWSDGKVGMVGISGYAGEQWRAAAQGHPALKAIFPYDACSAYGGMFGFRDFNPGGVIHTFPYLLDVFSTVHESRDVPGELPPEQQALWREAMRNPDYKQYVNLYNILTQKGQRTFVMYLMMTQPWEADGCRRACRGNVQEDQDPLLHRLRRLRVHLQASLARRAELLPQRPAAEEAPVHRPGASGAPLPPAPRRDPSLVRPLAQGQGHRHHGRAAGALLAHGGQRVAHRQGLAAARNAVAEVLPVALGGADHRRAPPHGTSSARRLANRTCSRRCRSRGPRRSSACAT